MSANAAFARLQQADWDKMGANALARELFNVLNSTTLGSTTSGTSDSSGTSTGSGGGTQQVFSGTVQSGSGNTYQVLLDTGATVSVTQLGINLADDIPITTTAVVFLLTDGTYIMSVPIFGIA